MTKIAFSNINKNLNVQEIKSNGNTYWLILDSNKNISKVFLNKCPHMGGILKKFDKGFKCDNHGWIFNFDGSNSVPKNPNLIPIDFIIEKDFLIINESIFRDIIPYENDYLEGSETLKLLSHASFLLNTNKIKILFDPWLKGDTYWNSWQHFPSYEIPKFDLVNINYIIITHPHPDHFHIPSLELFSRDVKIFFPNFPSKIIPSILKKMEFQNLHPVEWEQEVRLDDGVKFAFLRPTSFWEDSSVLVRVKNWVWLNQNDSGTPLNDHLIPENLDLLSSAFDIGASGYPMTWKISESRKIRILNNAREQTLKNLVSRCNALNVKYFAPFAGWWRHSRIEHQKYAQQIPHIKITDLMAELKNSSTKLLPTIPSCEVNLSKMTFKFDENCWYQLDRPWNIFDNIYNVEHSDSEIELALKNKLKNLSKMSSATNCENVKFTVEVLESDISVSQFFGNSSSTEIMMIKVQISKWIAELYAFGDETVTWDHLAIGYHALWERVPNDYPVNFMRLLQLNYVERMTSSIENEKSKILQTSLGKFIEVDSDLATAIFTRAGLPCASCVNLIGENLETAFNIHKIPLDTQHKVINELSGFIVNNSKS